MKVTTNDCGKPFWVNSELSSNFSKDLFHEVSKSKFEVEMSDELNRAIQKGMLPHSLSRVRQKTLRR